MQNSNSLSQQGLQILDLAHRYHRALDTFRRERDRNKRYNYGDQWSDTITVDGQSISEEQYIKQQGSVPLKNNLIRRLVRNVIGVYNSQVNEPVCVARDSQEHSLGQVMTELIRYNMQINRLKSIYTRSLEEFLISGMVVHKKTYGQRNGRIDCWTDYVQPNNFFVDTLMRDFRGWDCTCIGEIHYVTLADVWRHFAHSRQQCQWLRHQFGVSDALSICQVTEVWRKESRMAYRCHDPLTGRLYMMPESRYAEICRENMRRRQVGVAEIAAKWQMEDIWRYYFLSPTGAVLAEGDTPYRHGSHPYVVKLYPLIDGEIHSFVGDVIDQQRYTNRLITLYDWIMRASSKGVLLVPEDCIPRGCTPQDFADAWSRYNGVIFYKPSAQGNIPQQVANNSTNIGIRELLDVQLNFFEDISGINNAIQGKSSRVGMSAELYGQQTQNATSALLDVLDTFNEFVGECTFKDMKNIQQYYSIDRIRKIVGKDATLDGISDIEYDLRVTPSLNTPSAQQTSNEMLMEIWRSGQITLQQLLSAGNFPFADALQL